MHAGARRMPAERAHHAKRLGHVHPAPPVLAAAVSSASLSTTATSALQSTSPSGQTPSISTSTNRSSSSTLPSSLASSSAATSSALSTSLSATTQPQSVTTPSATLATTPTTLLTSLTSSSTSTPQTNAAAATNSSLSGGAIAGIIAGAVIVGTALIVFFVRKTYLRRRDRKRISWNGVPGLGEPKPIAVDSESPFTSPGNPASIPQRSVPVSPFEAFGQSVYSTPAPPPMSMHPHTFPTYGAPTPPPASYNNPTPVATYPAHPVPLTYSPGSATVPVPVGASASSTLSPVHAPMEALVKCTFVPTLPDELSITTGERVFIVEQYDDGWDLCMNRRGERGMVPRECLGHPPSDQPGVGWRNVQRMSSLNSDGRRY